MFFSHVQHVARLFDSILLDQLLNIHLEALAVAESVAIFGKDNHEPRVYPALIMSVDSRVRSLIGHLFNRR